MSNGQFRAWLFAQGGALRHPTLNIETGRVFALSPGEREERIPRCVSSRTLSVGRTSANNPGIVHCSLLIVHCSFWCTIQPLQVLAIPIERFGKPLVDRVRRRVTQQPRRLRKV